MPEFDRQLPRGSAIAVVIDASQAALADTVALLGAPAGAFVRAPRRKGK